MTCINSLFIPKQNAIHIPLTQLHSTKMVISVWVWVWVWWRR